MVGTDIETRFRSLVARGSEHGAVNFPTSPIGRPDVLETTMRAGAGPVRLPPIADTIAPVLGSGVVGASPVLGSVQGVIDPSRSDSTTVVMAQ